MITAVVLNYKRDISQTIKSIREQTAKSFILVINQGRDKYNGDCDQQITLWQNIGCYARFWAAGIIETEHFFTIDDDFVITDKYLFEKLINKSNKFPEWLLCINGNYPGDDKQSPYWHGKRSAEEGEKEMCNTGICFGRTEIFNKLPFNPYWYKQDGQGITRHEMKYADDIWVSAFIHVRVAEEIYKGIKSIENDNLGLSKQSEHMPIRDKVYLRLI